MYLALGGTSLVILVPKSYKANERFECIGPQSFNHVNPVLCTAIIIIIIVHLSSGILIWQLFKNAS